MNINLKTILSFILLLTLIIIYSCDANLTGVEDNPDPGIVRITITSNPADTYLVERSDTFSVFTPYTTAFNVNIFQGRVYSGEHFAILFPDLQSYAQKDSIYNVIEVKTSREDLEKIADQLENGEIKLEDLQAEYKKFKVFESYIPPGNYDNLTMGVSAPNQLNKSRVTLVAYSGKRFSIPLELPDDADLLMSFDVDFEVNPGEVTQINLQISPFQSVYRYRDSYRFDRQVEIIGVEYPNE